MRNTRVTAGALGNYINYFKLVNSFGRVESSDWPMESLCSEVFFLMEDL